MGIFTKQAHKYANYRPRYPGKMYHEILNHVDNLHYAWDCGTGSGQVAVELAKHFEMVYATDISKGQLANAYRAKNVQYLCTPAEKVPFQDNMFDLITVAQAIHWFDFDPFYSEVKRTIKHQGIFAVACYLRLTTSGEANEIFSDFYDEMFTQYFDINRRYVDEKYTTLPFPFEVLGDFEYENKYTWDLERIHGFMHSWSSVQKYKDDHGKDPTIPVIEKLAPYWTEPREVDFPVVLKVGRVSK